MSITAPDYVQYIEGHYLVSHTYIRNYSVDC